MRNAHVILAALGESLAAAVREIVVSIEHCIPLSVDSLESATDMLRSGMGDMVITYVADRAAVPNLICSLERWLSDGLSVPVAVLVEQNDPRLHFRLKQLGVKECLSQPLNLSRLGLLVDMVTLQRRLGFREASLLSTCEVTEFGGYLFDHESMRTLLEPVHRVASLATTVLLSGETGTGKTCLAHLIHDLSPRKAKPFAVVHCGTLTSTLINSEMFGHVRGSFTGADSDRKGRFDEAGEGTILLDEVDCLPLESQANLLRVVEERVYEPVGSTRSQHFQARIVVTSNRPLEQEVKNGRFRADLFYRLNVVNLKIPPLRSRRPLIRPMVNRFLRQFRPDTGADGFKVTRPAMEALEAYDWPGNIRELRNVIEQTVAFCRDDRIGVDDLPEHIRSTGRCHNAEGLREPSHSNQAVSSFDNSAGSKLENARRRVEREQLLMALHRNNNNRTSAAAELGISRVTLYAKLHRYGLV